MSYSFGFIASSKSEALSKLSSIASEADVKRAENAAVKEHNAGVIDASVETKALPYEDNAIPPADVFPVVQAALERHMTHDSKISLSVVGHVSEGGETFGLDVINVA